MCALQVVAILKILKAKGVPPRHDLAAAEAGLLEWRKTISIRMNLRMTSSNY